MKKIRKKIIIYGLILCIAFSFMGNRKTASATGGEVGVIGLEFLLMILLGYVANQYEVNLPMPNNQMDKYQMYKVAFAHNGNFDLDAIKKNDLYNVNTGQSYLEYVANGGTWYGIDFSEWITYQEYMEIRWQDLDMIKNGLLDYYDVPVLQNNNTATVSDNVENAYGVLKNKIINVSKEALQNSDLRNYDYMSIFYNSMSNNNLITIFAYNQVPNLLFRRYYNSSIYWYEYHLWWESKIDVYKIQYNFNTNGYWDVTYGMENDENVRVFQSTNSTQDDDAYFGSLPNRVLFSNHSIVVQRPTETAGYPDNQKEYPMGAIESSLSYRSFLASKYGTGSLGLEQGDKIEVKLDVIAQVIEDVPEYVIDNVGSTDKALENLKNIDEFAKEEYGESAIVPEITEVVEVVPIVYPIEYTEVKDITDSLDANFSGSLGAINFSTIDFPEYLLSGLLFVAWVFGQMWDNMGNYTTVLVFSASVAIIALLFGLGLKREKTRDKSDGPSKSRKTKKK